MLKFESLNSRFKTWAARIVILCFLTLAFASSIPPASAQSPDFSMAAAPFNPDAVPPGGTSSSNITVQPGTGFVGPVNLSCTVTSNATNTVSPPQCQVSPATLTAAGSAVATITTTAQTTTVGYNITISGQDASGTQSSPQLGLTVLAVTPQFTVTIQTAIAPSSVPAGSGAQGVITVNPVNGYHGEVTLACVSVSPVVTIPPVCSFTYPPPNQSLQVNGGSVTSTLTISTSGPEVTTAGVARRRSFYAFWLPLPMLTLVGLGAAIGGKRSRRAWGLWALFVLSGVLLLTPACGNTTNSTTTPNGVTPANTYTISVVGIDGNGLVSSNTGTNSSNPTVSLTVTAPPKR